LSASTSPSLLPLYTHILCFTTVSSVYSFIWDVYFDWGFRPFTSSVCAHRSADLHLQYSISFHGVICGCLTELSTVLLHWQRFLLRDELLFGHPAVYYAAIVVNAAGRFLWALTITPAAIVSNKTSDEMLVWVCVFRVSSPACSQFAVSPYSSIINSTVSNASRRVFPRWKSFVVSCGPYSGWSGSSCVSGTNC